MLRTVGGRPGWRRLLVSYFLAVSFRCQASSVTGIPSPRLPGSQYQQVNLPNRVFGQHRIAEHDHGVLRHDG